MAPGAQPVPGSPAAIRAYWTAARMREAEPADGLAPSPLASAGARRVAAGAATGSLHQRVQTTSSYPNRTQGKVFFTLPGGPPDGGDYACSATAVRSPGRSLVWTAGHCVFDPGVLGAGYATNWEFVPGYSGGRRPFGEWPASRLATTRQWRGTGVLERRRLGVRLRRRHRLAPVGSPASEPNRRPPNRLRPAPQPGLQRLRLSGRQPAEGVRRPPPVPVPVAVSGFRPQRRPAGCDPDLLRHDRRRQRRRMGAAPWRSWPRRLGHQLRLRG